MAISATYAQTADELKALQGPKKDSIAAIQGRVDALQTQIDALPGWKKGHLERLAPTFLVLATGIQKVKQIQAPGTLVSRLMPSLIFNKRNFLEKFRKCKSCLDQVR